MKWLFFIALFLLTANVNAQSVAYLTEELPDDSISYNDIKEHSAIRPAIRKGNSTTYNLIDNSTFSIYPLVDLNGAYADEIGYRTGAGVGFESVLSKWYIRLNGVGGIGKLGTLVNSNAYFVQSNTSDYTYADVHGRLAYTPNDIFNFQIGLDYNFIGEGNRSLFLSDYGVAQPFGQIRARFWRVEYTVMYQFLRERFNQQWRMKNAATHYFSLNLAKWLNVGVFESVIFQPKDTLLNRGYDVEYLNPVIFYRPQEYSIGSSDNVILGLSLSANYKNHMFYSQFMLDEFNLGELRKKTGWWANKFGAQFGLKSRFNAFGGKAFARLEYNFVRPYTYAHLNEMQNYGNQSATLAHPYGANFHEILGEFKWEKQQWMLKFFGSYYLRGLDKDGFSYGGNIYRPYTQRPGDYDHKIGQGQGVNGIHLNISGHYNVKAKFPFQIFVENHLFYNTLENQYSYQPVVGVRSQLWNDYRNY